MSDELLSDHTILRIKSATRDLVRLCGGVVRAGEVTNRSKSEVSRWQSVSDADVIDLMAALSLERDCGVPLITTVMAEINGRRVTDAASALSAKSVLESFADLQRRNAELTTEVAAALSDNTLTPAEAELVDRKAAEKEDSLRALRAGLAIVKSGGPAGVNEPLRRKG